jgi:hypothetical protein
VFPTEKSNVRLSVGSPQPGRRLTLIGRGSLGSQVQTVKLGLDLDTVSFTIPVHGGSVDGTSLRGQVVHRCSGPVHSRPDGVGTNAYGRTYDRIFEVC